MQLGNRPDRPVLLAANTIGSFYPGAGRIGQFRRDPAVPADHPEDWIASTTARTGSRSLGLTRLPDGRLLAERIAADPAGWLAPAHLDRYGARSALLVKLLDAGRRLPLHVHPDRTFARAHLASDFGKAEAWLVLQAEPGAGVHLGFSRDVTQDELTRWVTGQQVSHLLDACNLVPLRAGDVLFCPAGVPHAIGAGVLIVELQEMTDFSIMLEWEGFPIGPDQAFLGLPPELALAAVRREAVTGADLTVLSGAVLRPGPAAPGTVSLLPAGAGEFFVAEQVVASSTAVELDARFAVLIVNSGAGLLAGGSIDPTPVSAGQTFVIPYAAGPLSVTGEVSALRCYPAVESRSASSRSG